MSGQHSAFFIFACAGAMQLVLYVVIVLLGVHHCKPFPLHTPMIKESDRPQILFSSLWYDLTRDQTQPNPWQHLDSRQLQ